jgi:hypothetical protein
MSVIPATQEVEVGGSQSKASHSQRVKPYLENKTKSKMNVGMA